MMPAPGTSPSYISPAASWPISRNGEPGSSSRSTRSRGSSLPRSTCRLRCFSGPPLAASATSARSFSASARLCAARARNSSLSVAILLSIRGALILAGLAAHSAAAKLLAARALLGSIFTNQKRDKLGDPIPQPVESSCPQRFDRLVGQLERNGPMKTLVSVAATAACLSDAVAAQTPKQAVVPKGMEWATEGIHFSPALRSGDLIFVSG